MTDVALRRVGKRVDRTRDRSRPIRVDVPSAPSPPSTPSVPSAPSIQLASPWDRYWFGEIPAIRPYLLMKTVWCLVAFDVWMLRVPVGGRYGAGEFGVAHFAWLDALQPLPSPALYVGLMLSVGLLALVCVFTDASRPVRALVALLYTYGWAMSLHDGYQHHYFLSLVLATFVFFPRLRAREVIAPEMMTRRGRRKAEWRGPTVSAWAYALLGANIAIVYAYTALTKLDAEWLTGGVMGRLGRRLLGPVAIRVAEIGVPPELVWLLPGLGILALEAVVACGYLIAVRRDQIRDRRLRTVAWLAFFAAVSFHISAETVLNLRIGWFSYYMMALACVFFLPSDVLYRLASFVYRFAAGVIPARSAGRQETPRVGVSSVAAIGAAALAVVVGKALDLPGSNTVGVLFAAAFVAASLNAIARQRRQDVLSSAFALSLASILMWLAVGASAVRPLYHTYVGRDLQRRGQLTAAAAAFERAQGYAPNDKAIDKYLRRVDAQIAREEE